jgi:alpha-mannosidase
MKSGAVFTSVSLPSVHPMFRSLALEVIAYEHEPRLDFVYHMDKKMTYAKEALYFAFPVAGGDPKFRYEIGGGSVRPNEDHFPGACRDWFSVQRWVTVNTNDAGVAWSPIDTPLISLCDMNAGKWLDTLDISNGTIFAYAMNNYWFTNYKAGQDRDHVFRYALTSGASMDEQAAVVFGEDACAPLRVINTQHVRRGKGAAAPARQSFLQVDPANVAVSTIKRADDGDGIIVRLRETTGKDARAALQMNLPSAPTSAYACDLVERVQGELTLEGNRLSVDVPARSMVTVRLK